MADLDDQMTVSELNRLLAGKFGFALDMVPPGDLIPYANNPKKHKQKDLSALHKSVEAFGFKDVIIVDKDLEIIEGHGRQIEAVNKGLDAVLVLKALDLTKKQANALRAASNRIVELSTWDERLLVTDALPAINEVFGGLDDLQWERYADTLLPDLAMEDTVGIVQGDVYADPSSPISPVSMGAAEPIVALAPNDDNPQSVSSAGMQSAAQIAEAEDEMFPTDNEWEIPVLSLKYQATSTTLPIMKWREFSMKHSMPGTWHFYCEDFKFNELWQDPRGPLYSKPKNCIEVNYSAGEQTARANVMGLTFKKRWISRWWQSRGVFIFVDLNCDPRHQDINLIGVPKGWRAWATRSYFDGIPYVYDQFELAKEHAGTDDILFVVAGGGNETKEAAMEEGWVWFPLDMDIYRTNGKMPSRKTPDVFLDEYKKRQMEAMVTADAER